MSSDLNHLDFIDLISQRHHDLRHYTEQMWSNYSTTYISHSEWFILTKIYQSGETTIANISKQVDISRQATHKFVNRLKEKELVEIGSLAHNKKEKAISLSPLGKEYVETNESLKAELENKIGEKIGLARLQSLKDILRADWGL